MPLAFDSLSHRTVAFGFFNIECDMLLLERLFFFADRFCDAVVALARGRAASAAAALFAFPGWRIRDARSAGNVNLAIAGRDLSGFIGATYRAFPFPTDPAAFRQQPDGAKNRPAFEEMIGGFGAPGQIALRWDGAGGPDERLSVAEYVFELRSFAALVAYVDRGGYPRWKDGRRPGYATGMMDTLRHLSSPLLGVPKIEAE